MAGPGQHSLAPILEQRLESNKRMCQSCLKPHPHTHPNQTTKSRSTLISACSFMPPSQVMSLVHLQSAKQSSNASQVPRKAASAIEMRNQRKQFNQKQPCLRKGGKPFRAGSPPTRTPRRRRRTPARCGGAMSPPPRTVRAVRGSRARSATAPRSPAGARRARRHRCERMAWTALPRDAEGVRCGAAASGPTPLFGRGTATAPSSRVFRRGDADYKTAVTTLGETRGPGQSVRPLVCGSGPCPAGARDSDEARPGPARPGVPCRDGAAVSEDNSEVTRIRLTRPAIQF
jgi:hypothetical protein